MTTRAWVQRDPSHWTRVLARVAVASAVEVDAAARRAQAAQAEWARMPGEERIAFLTSWGRRLQARAGELAEVLATEIGKPVGDGAEEVRRAVGLLDATAALMASTPAWEPCDDDVTARRRPLGVVGVITPWNNPVAIPVGKLAPALALGNAVVWKPALPTPAATQLVTGALAASGIAPDLLTVVTGNGTTAGAVIAHPAVAAVSLTGSSKTGRRAARRCASLLKPLQAELGGNNAAIVLAGADLDQAAGDLARSAYSFAGQRCTAARRLIVERSVERAFLDRFETAVKRYEPGDPHDPATTVGPLVSRHQQRRVLGRLGLNRVLFGGDIPARLADGCFVRPALVRPRSFHDDLVTEETFGPVAVLLTVESRDEAFALANAVPQGLVAALYSDDPDDQRRFLDTVEAGSLKLNRPTIDVAPRAPFVGWKQSGWGPPEHGRWDLDFYTRPQAVYRSGPG